MTSINPIGLIIVITQAIVDGSGVLYDANGINKQVLRGVRFIGSYTMQIPSTSR